MTTVAREALLVMDVQNGVVGRLGDPGALLDTLGSAVKAARASGLPVIYARVAFRDGTPEISPNNHGSAGAARPAEATACGYGA
jgi:nicotinamidase-related amidase